MRQYGVDEFITCHVIRNTEARFCNRKRPNDWVTPTVEHLIRTHINLIHKMKKYLPITDVAIEINRFAFMLLDDPTVAGVDFQNGPLKDYRGVKDAIYDMQDGKCLLCSQPIEQYHHIVPRSANGSDTLENLAGLCSHCHDNVHKNQKNAKRLSNKKSGLMKKYTALSALNQAIPFIYKRLVDEFGEKHVHHCTGRETSMVRNSLGYTKTKDNQLHEIDAYCIALLSMNCQLVRQPMISHVYQIKQFRRQNRAIINNQRERSYYYEGKLVAKNRKARTEQKDDSLETWYQKLVLEYGEKEAERMRSVLQVKKSVRRYNTMNRMMPGAVFYYQGERYVLSGQISNGQYYRAVGQQMRNFVAKECKIIKQNEGLVFLG